jgi:hypothetical protein
VEPGLNGNLSLAGNVYSPEDPNGTATEKLSVLLCSVIGRFHGGTDMSGVWGSIVVKALHY